MTILFECCVPTEGPWMSSDSVANAVFELNISCLQTTRHKIIVVFSKPAFKLTYLWLSVINFGLEVYKLVQLFQNSLESINKYILPKASLCSTLILASNLTSVSLDFSSISSSLMDSYFCSRNCFSCWIASNLEFLLCSSISNFLKFWISSLALLAMYSWLSLEVLK
jgi:hypothetical protein